MISFKTFVRSGILLIIIGFLLNQFQPADLYSTAGWTKDNSLMYILKQGELQFKADNAKRLQEKRIQVIESSLKHHALHQILKEKIKNDILPEERIRAYYRELARMTPEKREEFQRQMMTTRLAKGSQVNGSYGSISGTTLVDGSPNSVYVEAFDEYGYWAGNDTSDYSTGAYTIPNLLPGNYFVATNSYVYVNEIYNDILRDNWESWRQVIDNGYLVKVNSGSGTPGIDFDIQTGGTISGTFYEADGVTPIPYGGFNLNMYSATDSNDVIYYGYAFTDDKGEYSDQYPYFGNFKLCAEDTSYYNDYEQEYYNNKKSWETADILSLGSYSDVLSNINFNMDSLQFPDIALGGIGGTVGTAGGLAFLGYAVAFNPADTSIAGLGVVLLGAYTIPNLADGEYIVYVDDIAGSLTGSGNNIGEYYDNVRNPAQATKVNVANNNTTRNINFMLEPGGSISGTVIGPAQTKLDCTLVIALNQDLLDFDLTTLLATQGSQLGLKKQGEGQHSIEGIDPFLANVWFDVAFTDTTGKYRLSGLPAGNYILRTVSLLKYYGTVLDEYYQNVHSPLEYQKATPVPVLILQETQNIDFELEAPGAILGKVTDSGGTTLLDSVIVLALDAATGIPALILPAFSNSMGEFTIGPLIPGDYKLIAIPEIDESPFYLSEFYDGQRTLESATAVNVAFGGIVPGIHFTLDTGGFIQGLVELTPGYRAGADTLDNILVTAYDAASGKLMGTSTTTFSGGYRIGHLPVGQYKVAAIPAYPGFAATYSGGGHTFDDAASSAILVASDDSARADITLDSENGSISGNVVYGPTGLPIASFVMAYDATGHTVSVGSSQFSLAKNLESNLGSGYLIPGLRVGQYYVRTVALYGILDLLLNHDLLKAGAPTGDPILPIPIDAWYQNIEIDPESDWDIFQMIFGFTSVYGTTPLPLQSTIPGGATAVSVSSGADTPNINFSLNDLLSDIEEISPHPSEFSLYQNYPNPFNPQTTIQYNLMREAKVEIRIFDVTGKEVVKLISKNQKAGSYQVIWNGYDNQGQSVASGIYLYQLKTEASQATRRLVLIR